MQRLLYFFGLLSFFDQNCAIKRVSEQLAASPSPFPASATVSPSSASDLDWDVVAQAHLWRSWDLDKSVHGWPCSFAVFAVFLLMV